MAEERRLETHIKAATGAGVGLITSELLSEFITRAAGLTGTAKFGGKTLTKIGIAALFLALIPVAPVGLGLFLLVAGWSSLGSILVDLIAVVVPGGIPRIAERAALSLRAAALGTATVTKELKALEVSVREVPKKQEIEVVRSVK